MAIDDHMGDGFRGEVLLLTAAQDHDIRHWGELKATLMPLL